MYYLYRHIRLDKNEPFYIGIGKVPKKIFSHNTEYPRAFQMTNRSNHWINITNKSEYEVEIIYESEDVNEIKQKEIEFINLYGRKDLGLGPLVNLTDGGDGCVNYRATDSVRKRISESNIGISKGKGIPKSEEHKKNISLSRIGIIPWNKGKLHSAETIIKMKKKAQERLRDGRY